MNSIEQKFVSFVRSENLINLKDKVLVAFSGGADSTCLLLILKKFSEKFNIQIGAAHVNHQLRGDDSNKDEKFCKDLCEQENISYHSLSVNVKKEYADSKKTIEEAARDLRYSALNEIAQKNGYNKIATAHNINDNTETVIYNLIKGTGLAGLSGIPTQRDNIIRPMLNISRNEIVQYLISNEIEYKEDYTNRDRKFSRNFLRHEVLPKFNKINPSFNKAIFNNSQILSRLKEHVESEVIQSVNRYLDLESDEIKISKELFLNESEFLVSEIIKYALQQLEMTDITKSDINKIIDLNSKQTGISEQLKSNFIALNDRDQIAIRLNKWNEINTKIVVGGNVKINNSEFGIEKVDLKVVESNSSSNEEIISADNTDDIFILRSWKYGDYFYPLGMKGRKKVSDFLTDVKEPSANKKERLVLTNRNNIVWVVGLRLDERYKITENTKSAYRLWIN